jgi:outer membrane protein insertion porin family
MQICRSLLLIIFSAVAAHPVAQVRAQEDMIQIASITFEGNRGMEARQLKLLLRMSPEGGAYVPANLQADLLQVEMAYQDSGFLKVHLDPPEVRIQAVGGRKTAAIRIAVAEGPRYTTGEVTVKNARALAPETLRQLSPLGKGQPYSRIKAVQWQAKVEDAYRALGYLRSSCPAHETVNESDKIVSCSLECAEGKLYSVGKITIAGDGSISPAEFKRRLLFSEGGVFNPEMVVMSIQFLNQSRLYQPMSNSDVEIRIDDDKGTVDLSIRVVLLKR